VRTLTTIIGLLLVSSPAFAQAIGASCPDLSVTGIRSKDELSKFLGSLKRAATSRDAAALSKAIHYPLHVSTEPKRKPIKNEEDLKKNIDSIFTAKVLSAIERQKFEEIFCRDQGAMLGDGEVWIDEQRGKIGVKTINL
jgi:hypothetical protein